MPQITRKEFMIGVHIAVDVHGDVSEDELNALGERLALNVDMELFTPHTGVTFEEIRGGESALPATLVVSGTPSAWPIGCTITCVVPEREGEPTLSDNTFYTLKDLQEGVVLTTDVLTDVRVSADRFLYIYSVRAKVGNGS